MTVINSTRFECEREGAVSVPPYLNYDLKSFTIGSILNVIFLCDLNQIIDINILYTVHIRRCIAVIEVINTHTHIRTVYCICAYSYNNSNNRNCLGQSMKILTYTVLSMSFDDNNQRQQHEIDSILMTTIHALLSKSYTRHAKN